MSVQSDDLPTTPAEASDSDELSDDAEPTAVDDLETLRGDLAEITQNADEYLRLAQRTQADFINYRRRVDEERAQLAREANLIYIQRLLPILDDFERALANAAGGELESSWGRGISLVERN